MWRKSLHDEFGYFDPQCFISGDYEFWLRVSQRHEFLYIKEILGNRVLTDECLSMSEHHTKDSRSFLEDRIIRLAYRYAWENSIIIDRRGISANPLFKNWHDVKLWKRRIRAKIKNKPFTVTQSVKSISDSHQQLAPALSIVIPAKCDSENLRACLASLGSQTNSDFELVLIDRSGSIAALAPENGSLNYPLRYVSLREDWGQPAARNIGIHFARGRFVAFIDERCTLHPEFVGNTITHFSNDNILGLRGKILPPPAFRGYSPKHFDLGDNPLLSTCEEGSCVFRRDALLKLDGFDITLVGFDIPEICYRLYKSDDKNIYAVVYYPDVVTYQDCCVDVDAYHRRDFKMYVGRKYAITKDAKMQNYLDFFQNFNPANRKLVESDFNKLMSIALMLKGPYPADAIEWATKAFALKPGDIRCHYILGELYVKVNNYTRATDLLESMVEPLLAMLDYGYSTLAGYNPDQLKNPAVCFTAVFNNLKNTSEYFASVATMLAQCYVSQKAFGKIKTIYLCLLQNKAIVLTDQLNNDFTSVLAKLHNIEPEPIEPKTKIAFTKPTASTRQPMRPDVSTSELQHDYVEIITIAVFLQKYYPELALKWAQKAVAVDPNRIKGRYLLGSLYFGMESYDKAADMLEPIFLTQMQNLGNPAVSALEFEHQTANVDCCLSVGTMLAQCYMKEGQYGKLKMVYTLLLNSPYLAMPPEQRASIHALLGKLQNVEDVPVQAATPQIDSPVHYPLKPEPCVNAADERGEKYLVSAIVSTYNSETFIRGCLEDLESQTIADRLEIIVVNSGSEQNEESIVKEFQEKYGNIVYIKTEREGLYSAWNRAIKAASGQFLTNANTDDRHRRDAFEVMANTLLKNTDVVLVYGNQIITDTPNPSFENHHVIEMAKRPEFSRQRLLFGCCVGSQPMWRKSLHDEFGGFDETLVCAADWDFWLKIAQKHNFKHIDEFMGLFYRNENGIEHGRKIHSLYERYAVGKRYGNPYISVIQQYNAPGNPLVSIIVTAYNAADYISRAIESILIQSYRNFEIIVVDDGSTDNTAEIVRGFKNEPIKYFFKGNGGVASARNFGLQKSGGSFIIMLDSDDMMTPDYIASHLQGFEQHPEADMVYCDDLLIDEQDKPIRIINRPEYSNPDGIISDMFRCGFPVVHFKTCIRRSVFDKLGLYDERLIVAEDYDMMRRFIKQQLKMRHLPAALYLRRLRADSLSKDFNAVKAKSHFDVIRRFTETFTPEQLFPDVQWDALPAGQKTMLAKCKEALAYLGIGEQYINSKAPDYAEAAFEMACAEMDDCCKIEPGNQQVRNLREKCQFIRDKRVSNAGKDIYQQV
jgi:glycosyltransferase involved in cell wall biosynthesis